MLTSAFRSRRLMAVLSLLLLLLLLPLLTAAMTHGLVVQHLAMEPQDQIAEIGARVTLPCRVVNKQGVLQWTRDDFGLGTRRQLAGFERYAMIGSDEEGDFSLQIWPVELEDDAQFQCQVSAAGHDHPVVRSRYATLTVLVAPDAPVITQGDVFQATEDREIELECVSANGKPAAEITWIDGFGTVLTQGISYLLEPAADMRRFTARSVLRLTPTKEMNNRTVVCQAQNTVDKAYRTAAIRLEVQYAPKVTVTVVNGAVDGGSGQIPDGATIEAMCVVDANPPEVTYQWFVDDEEVQPVQRGRVMSLTNVTRTQQNSILKCVAQNAIGISSDSETFDVIYQPFFTRRPENHEADSQDEVTLTCEVDGNPLPEIVWVFDPAPDVTGARSPRVVGTSPTLHLVAASDTAGRYWCKATSPGFVEIRAEAAVLLKGPPRIVSANEQFATTASRADDGTDAVQLECVATSVPKAKHVSWAYNGQLIDFDVDIAFEMREAFVPNGVRSTLTIADDWRDYLGVYSCIVINAYGTDTLDIMFREPERLSMVILMGGSGVLLLILLLGIVTITCCMRSTQKVLPPADLIPKESVMTLKAPHISKSKSAAAAAAASKTNGSSLGIPLSAAATAYGGSNAMMTTVGTTAAATATALPVVLPNAAAAAAAGASMTTSISPMGGLDGLPDYQESNSGSYSTTTTISINKNDLLLAGGRMTLPHQHHQHQQQQQLPALNGSLTLLSNGSGSLGMPPAMHQSMLSSFTASHSPQPRFSGAFGDNLSIHTNQSSIIGIGTGNNASYVDYARDFYSPTVQNTANTFTQLQMQQRDPPTYV